MLSDFVAVLPLVAAVQAFSTLIPRQGIAPLTTSEIDSYTPYTHFAGTAYCPASKTMTWDCGENCGNNPDFEPVASGGDGDSIQFWYVGYSPSLSTVIVAHQGTNRSQLQSILTDLNAVRGNLDQLLFPGLPKDIEVHKGFRDDHSKTALNILSAVQAALSRYGSNSVTLVGHSLGAALSLLDSVYLPLHLLEGTTFRSILYGLPRVGNQDFADYVDANLHITHINNQKDPIPITPSMHWGYVHPAGEVHITSSLVWENCPGQDNPSTLCIVGDVPSVHGGNLNDHDGPYNGVRVTCSGK